MEKPQELNEALLKAVEMVYGHKPHVYYDFYALSTAIEKATGKMVSSTTLRRFWGYQETDKHISPSRYTLDTLSIYVGFKSWTDFCECRNNPLQSNSGIIYNEYLHASDLVEGTVVRLTWKPNRQLWLRYLGDNMWTIVKSINAKLSEGHTFFCATFIKHLPLVLTRVTKDGSKPVIYRCGTEGGIDFHVER